MHPVLGLSGVSSFDRKVIEALDRLGPSSQTGLRDAVDGEVSLASLSRSIARSMAIGLVEKTGSTKSARFSVSPRIARFLKAPARRPKVHYDPALILDYVPNRTRWLAPEAEIKMRQAASLAGPRLDASSYSKKIAERFLIDLSWASSFLEGNTYDYLQTEALIRYAERASGKDFSETAMILNHKRAVTFLLEVSSLPKIVPETLQRMHALLMRDLLSVEDLGRIRICDAGIGGSSYVPSSDAKILREGLNRLCWNTAETENPFEASFHLLAGLSYLQAFEDGNKRMGRLSCNVPLLGHGLPPMSFTTIGKADYIMGLIVFYETGDPSLLSDVVAGAYADTAPGYSSALTSRKLPRTVEIVKRREIDRLIGEFVRNRISGDRKSLYEHLNGTFVDLNEDDRLFVRSIVVETVTGITTENAVIWGFSVDDVEKFRAAMTDDGGPKP